MVTTLETNYPYRTWVVFDDGRCEMYCPGFHFYRENIVEMKISESQDALNLDGFTKLEKLYLPPNRFKFLLINNCPKLGKIVDLPNEIRHLVVDRNMIEDLESPMFEGIELDIFY